MSQNQRRPDSYNYEKRSIDLENKCVRIPVYMPSVSKVSGIDFEVIPDQILEKLKKEYTQFDFENGRWDTKGDKDGTHEYLFFYKEKLSQE